MQIRRKSYFANTVESALALAAQELGDETLLVDSRRSKPEQAHLGAYEVIVEAPDATLEGDLKAGAVQQSAEYDRLLHDLASLRAEIGRLSKTLIRGAMIGSPQRWVLPSLAEIGQELLAADLPGDMTAELLGSFQAQNSFDANSSGLLVRRAFIAHCARAVQAGLESPRVMAVVGPAGAGKTTLLAKIAVKYGIAVQRGITFVNTDTHKIASGEQLRSYASILGSRFESVATVGSLARVLSSLRSGELVLIDTPGLGPGEMDLAPEWSSFFASNQAIEVHLVLTAPTRSADLLTSLTRWSQYRPARLAFTRLDETECYGGILAAAVASRLPLSFFSAGQRVPEDLQEASAAGLMNLLFGGQRATTSAAAA